MKYRTISVFLIIIPIILSGQKGSIEILNGTFLGSEGRNYYGDRAPDELDIIWEHYLGKGETVISRKIGSVEWAGAGWTGQPLLVREENDTFLIQGAYDHHLKKIKTSNGELVWQYKFDDVVKGTGTIWLNEEAENVGNRVIILQGSRLGVGNYLDTTHIPSYRAISYYTGEELWRKNVAWTDSYSRDVDGSALIINDTAYIGLENSLFTVFSPDPSNAENLEGMFQPLIYKQLRLYNAEDVQNHKYNVVTESSPSRIGRMIYIPSGSGHVWGYDMDREELTWDFFIGSDMDGSAIVTYDSCILVSVEKQYIAGNGGVFKLDPQKMPDQSVEWYYPLPDSELSSWEGGVIGSAAVSDGYNDLHLAAFVGIDGNLKVVQHDAVTEKMNFGPDSIQRFPAPVEVFSYSTGPSISTPIFTDSKLVVCGYDGVYLFKYDENLIFELIDHFGVPVESTPFIAGGRIFIASKNGYLYCLGSNN